MNDSFTPLTETIDTATLMDACARHYGLSTARYQQQYDLGIISDNTHEQVVADVYMLELYVPTYVDPFDVHAMHDAGINIHQANPITDTDQLPF